MILDGKQTRDAIIEELKDKIKLKNMQPKLVIYEIGENQASKIYIKNKLNFARKAKIEVEVIRFTSEANIQDILKSIKNKNAEQTTNGIIVQLPLPERLKQYQSKIINTIDPKKDVDGLTTYNFGLMAQEQETNFVPCTANGILKLLERNKIKIASKNITIIGKSNLVGKPIALLLMKQGATVTICHKQTSDLEKHTINADILIVAAGSPKLIKLKHTNKNQVIIDVGINYVDNKIIGDVDYENVKNEVLAITPVPGGVGPLTVAGLLLNTTNAYEKQNKK